MRADRLLAFTGLLATAVALLVAPAAAPQRAATSPCHAAVRTGVLPAWARAGFSSPRPRMPHVLGRSGKIVAILFGYPLRSPAGAERNNKILWVSRTLPGTPAALWIKAQRMDGAAGVGPAVERVLRGGPGPSIVDMPAPGCWRLRLSWSGRRDTLDLAYGTGG